MQNVETKVTLSCPGNCYTLSAQPHVVIDKTLRALRKLAFYSEPNCHSVLVNIVFYLFSSKTRL